MKMFEAFSLFCKRWGGKTVQIAEQLLRNYTPVGFCANDAICGAMLPPTTTTTTQIDARPVRWVGLNGIKINKSCIPSFLMSMASRILIPRCHDAEASDEFHLLEEKQSNGIHFGRRTRIWTRTRESDVNKMV